MKKVFFFCLLCFFLVSCKSNDNPDNNILDETLRLSYFKLDESKSKAKSTLLFDNEKSANDCNTYLKLTKNNNILESIENQLVKSEYLICDSLLAISQFGLFPGEVQYEKIGEKLLSDLDLRTFPNSLSRLTSENSFTLKNLFPDLSKAIGNTAVFESEDWVLTLEVVAIINANKNNYQDWVMQMADEAKIGTYRNYATFIVYDIQNNNILKATPYP